MENSNPRWHGLGNPSTAHRIGEGDVTFTRIDGRTIRFDNVLVDSIGPGAEAHGIIAFERFDTDEITHVPFVESWTVAYRY